MKKDNIIISIICGIVLLSIILFFYHNYKNFFQYDNNAEINESLVKKDMEKIKARDGIRGPQHPTPFIVKREEVDRNLFENTHYNLLGQLIYLQRDQLPDAEKKLYANNKDTKEYILGYLNGQQGTPFEYGETVELKRKYPYYVQWDRRWAYDALGGTNVAIGGCGPTVVAMALSGILKDEKAVRAARAKFEQLCAELGLAVLHASACKITGKEGNREFFYLLKRMNDEI